MQATPEIATDRAAKDKAKATPAPRVLPAIRMPEAARAAARLERGPARETVKATAAAKRIQKAEVLAAARSGVPEGLLAMELVVAVA
jgi:hypothetical protein